MKKLMFLICAVTWSYCTNAQCDSNLPINETFDTNTIGTCWQINDQDGDSKNWLWYSYSAYYGGHKVIASYSVSTSVGALTPDNWIMSYPIDLTSFSSGDNVHLSWKIRAGLSYASHEYYSVYAATNNNISSFTSSPVKRSEYIDEVGGAVNFVTRTLDVSAFVGNTVYIAFRHHNSSNQSNIEIDEIIIASVGSHQECVSDSDNDGVCDPVDQCPGLNDALIGTPCNDGNPCTINDVYNSNCGCSGTFADSDSDGICDFNDVCPGFDDTIDANGNGTPDGCDISSCTENTANFPNNPLMHSGSGSKSTTLILPSESQNISFTISNIEEKLKGKQSGYYIERVLVTYKDATGLSKTNGTYLGNQISSATINIPDNAQSITISLDDAYDGNAGSTMSINLSPVAFCSTSTTNPSPCTDNYGNFSKNPLTHSGSGSNSTTLNLPTNSQDASFTISGLDAKTKGKGGSLYIETVVVSYVDGLGVSKQYGTYNGSNVSSASISITGKVKSITVSLSTFSGITSSTMSVDLSEIAFCVSSSSSSTANSSTKEVNSQQVNINEPIDTSFKIYPNPASSKLFVKSSGLNNSKVNITIYNLNGVQVRSFKLNSSYSMNHELDITGIATGLYVLNIIDESNGLLKTDRIVIK